MMMNTAYILIPALPFAAFLIIALGSRWVGEASHRLAIPAVFASFILSVLACVDVYQNGARSIPLYTIIKSGSLTVEAGLYVDAITVLLLFLVTGVSSLVHVFSSRYMQADPRYARFFALIALFTSAMVMLVMGANLFMLFMFWEIMGLCSYLLISHWSRRPSACDAATKAFLVNGVADIGLAFGIYLTWATFGTLDIQAILSAAPNYADQTVNLLGWLGLEWQAPILPVIALLLFMGPIGKSAQIPLHVWLPFAMEAPTPVSALIHAATMVNAGVYLLIRMGPLYVLAPTIMTVVAIIGGVTALFAAVVALTAFDIKRILAYSTISQLGFMVLACGVGAYGAAIFHLLTHGAMKSFLFLSAGSALHNLGGTHHGEQAEHEGPSRTRVSRQQVPLYVGALIMALIPPIIIFWGPYEQLWVMSHLAQARVVFWILGLATVFFTAFYLFQGTMDIFTPSGRVDWSEGFRPGMMRPQLFSASLLLGLIPITAGLAVFRILIWSGFLEFIFPALPGATAASAKIPLADWSPASLIPGVGVAIAGWATAFYFHIFPAHPSAWWSERKKTFYVFLLNRGYFDEVYATLIVRPTLRVASWLWRVVDGGIDRAYMAAAGASAGMARTLWEGVDVWIIDRPANGLAAASLRMATGLSKFVTHNKSDEPLVTFVLLRLLVFVILLLVLAEQIEHYFLG
ncbi:MAG: NADH-quinone oxidoreductase subunit L [Nitrospiraceae bacterium]|nr:NADH-quinone oxidoreductase subunit L [Nitrospiraceae bacterium]